MNDLATQSEKTFNPLQNFDVEEMEKFYSAKVYLNCLDARELLDSCILSKEEIRQYDGTYRRVEGTTYRAAILGPVYKEDCRYIPNYSSETIVYISTRMLMDKLDASLYYWRELNSGLVKLLTSHKSVEYDVISNWVKMVHFMAPRILASQN